MMGIPHTQSRLYHETLQDLPWEPLACWCSVHARALALAEAPAPEAAPGEAAALGGSAAAPDVVGALAATQTLTVADGGADSQHRSEQAEQPGNWVEGGSVGSGPDCAHQAWAVKKWGDSDPFLNYICLFGVFSYTDSIK